MTASIRSGTKKARILGEFLNGGEIHRFQAERLGDHVLHSTVSALERLGLKFPRRNLTVPGWGGHETTVTAYRLAPESMQLARALLGMHTAPRPAVGLDAADAYAKASRG